MSENLHLVFSKPPEAIPDAEYIEGDPRDVMRELDKQVASGGCHLAVG